MSRFGGRHLLLSDKLLGSGDAGYWLATTLHRGDRIKVTDHVSPDANLSQAIGGGPQVVKQGVFYDDPNQPAPGYDYTLNPQTAVGVTKDGNHALFVVFDGRFSGPRQSRGMINAEVADFMLAHGAYNALLFDSGGSSEMVARLPGHRAVSVINWPSDGHERPVANGLFIYYNNHLAQLLATFRIERLRRMHEGGPWHICTAGVPVQNSSPTNTMGQSLKPNERGRNSLMRTA